MIKIDPNHRKERDRAKFYVTFAFFPTTSVCQFFPTLRCQRRDAAPAHKDQTHLSTTCWLVCGCVSVRNTRFKHQLILSKCSSTNHTVEECAPRQGCQICLFWSFKSCFSKKVASLQKCQKIIQKRQFDSRIWQPCTHFATCWGPAICVQLSMSVSSTNVAPLHKYHRRRRSGSCSCGR